MHIYIEDEHRGGNSRGHHQGEQRGRGATSTENGRANQHAQQHGAMGSVLAASGQIARLVRHGRAHNSPRNAKTGSSLTALRIAAALPPNVTITAMARITGNSTGGMEISELKIEWPI